MASNDLEMHELEEEEHLDDVQLTMDTDDHPHDDHHDDLDEHHDDTGSLLEGADPETPTGELKRLREINSKLVKRWSVTSILLVCSLIAFIIAAAVRPTPVIVPRNNNTNGTMSEFFPLNSVLLKMVKTDNIMAHLTTLEEIANSHGGTRAVGAGSNATADYIVTRLRQMKGTDDSEFYDIDVRTFSVASFTNLATPVMQQGATNYVYNTDFTGLGYEGSGNVTAMVQSVANVGCDASDFPVLTGKIALISRGNCSFHDKVVFATNAGAVAAIIYNEGNSAERMGIFRGTLGLPATIPVFGTTYALGQQFKNGVNVTLHLFSHTLMQTEWTRNVCATSKQGKNSVVILVGSHLDSVPAGPGINDNGSGTSTTLEIAAQLAASQGSAQPFDNSIVIQNKVRFCWWGAEEEGLLGSTFYVNDLKANNPNALANIKMNLNFDMLGSPNGFYGIYKGQAAASNIRTHSHYVQSLFQKFFVAYDLHYELVEFNGRSDYGPFIGNGVPAGGLDSGAEVIKSVDLAKKVGGIPQVAFDPCYHQACDITAFINKDILTPNARGVAYVLEQLVKDADLVATMDKGAIHV